MEGGPRVVNVSSVAAKQGRIDFDDLYLVKNYSGLKAYQASKLANLLFTFQFQRLAKQKGKKNIYKILKKNY